MAWQYTDDVAAANNAGNALDKQLEDYKAKGDPVALSADLQKEKGEVTRLKGELETAQNSMKSMVKKEDLDTAAADVTRLKGELSTANTELQKAQGKSKVEAAKLGQAPVKDNPVTGMTDPKGNDVKKEDPDAPKVQGYRRLAGLFAKQQPGMVAHQGAAATAEE